MNIKEINGFKEYVHDNFFPICILNTKLKQLNIICFPDTILIYIKPKYTKSFSSAYNKFMQNVIVEDLKEIIKKFSKAEIKEITIEKINNDIKKTLATKYGKEYVSKLADIFLNDYLLKEEK